MCSLHVVVWIEYWAGIQIQDCVGNISPKPFRKKKRLSLGELENSSGNSLHGTTTESKAHFPYPSQPCIQARKGVREAKQSFIQSGKSRGKCFQRTFAFQGASRRKHCLWAQMCLVFCKWSRLFPGLYLNGTPGPDYIETQTSVRISSNGRIEKAMDSWSQKSF